MIIEITGAGFKNKGAELMLYATLQQITKIVPDSEIVMNMEIGSFKQRKSLGIKHLTWRHSWNFPFLGPAINFTIRILPKFIRKTLNLVIRQEVNCVLDISGYCYSDLFGVKPSKAMSKYYQRLVLNGGKVILLPQALGPFENSQVKEYFSVILKNSTLIFARDEISFDHVVKNYREHPYVKISPDFTLLLKETEPKYIHDTSGKVCIIPNIKMMDSVDELRKNSYINTLKQIIDHLIKREVDFFILLHEIKRDRKILDILQDSLSNSAQIVTELDPLHIKGILGKCRFVVSSRYHGLINALSQNVPALGTTWSHKYETLFAEYGCSELVLTDPDVTEIIPVVLDRLLDEGERRSISEKLVSYNERKKEQTIRMWEEVEMVLTGKTTTISNRSFSSFE